MSKQLAISVVGCGWLGLPLAESLIIRGYAIKGTSTHENKLEALRKAGIDPYLVHFGTKNSISSKILESDILVINIPPGTRTPDGAQNFRQMANYFTENIPESPIKKIILVSSTSVYGETNRQVSESDIVIPDSESGKLLLEIENQFLRIKNKQICILRPAGLVGPQRHPGRFMRERASIDNGLAPVNLIHRDDVIGIITKLIEKEDTHGIYNACSPEHPPKHEFYTLAAEVSGYQPANFIPEKTRWKTINSIRVNDELGYQFKYPSLMDWLRKKPAQ